MKTFIIDQNYFRKPDLRLHLEAASQDDKYIVTDEAVIEMMKSQQWESTTRRSLQILANHPKHAQVGCSTSELIRTELELRGPVASIVLNEAEEWFHSLLNEIAQGGASEELCGIKDRLPSAIAKVLPYQLNHRQNKKSLLALKDDALRLFDMRSLKKLPLKIAVDETISKIKRMAANSIAPILAEHGFRKAQALDFINRSPLIFRLNVGMLLMGMKWAYHGGLESLPERKCTNELMDLRYAVLATYCQDVLTKENSVLEMRRDVVASLN